MRAHTTYHMRATVQFPEGLQYLDADHAFTTGGLPPEREPRVTVRRPGSLAPSPGVELLDLISFSDQVTAAVLDLEGNLIWFYDLGPEPASGFPFPIKLLANGNMLMVVGFGPVDRHPPDRVREIDLAGYTISEFSVLELNRWLADAGFQLVVLDLHHDILPLPNGHLILLGNETRLVGHSLVLGDALVDLDQNRRPVWVWSTFDHLDVNRHPYGLPDWTHSNAVIYSPDDGNLILSIRNQHWVIKIDYQDGRGRGDILWRLGPGGDFTLEGGGPRDWNYAQHYPVLISPRSAGVFPLMLYDNGNGRILDRYDMPCEPRAPTPCYSRAVTFQLDETSRRVRILWQDRLSYYSVCCGRIGVLPNQDVEFDIPFASGNPLISTVQEVTQEQNPQLVWQLDIFNQLAYRAFRIPSLYPGVQW
jgi:hypothetical protein